MEETFKSLLMESQVFTIALVALVVVGMALYLAYYVIRNGSHKD